MASNVLTVQATSIINAQGQPVVLRGFNLGGWMNMENFITGYPANEEAQRQAIRAVLGEETYSTSVCNTPTWRTFWPSSQESLPEAERNHHANSRLDGEERTRDRL